MCLVEDADPADVWFEVERRARTEHRCDGCRRTIRVGERYRHITSLYDGRWRRYHHCAHCVKASDLLTEECGGYLPRRVLEDLEEHVESYRGARREYPWTARAAKFVGAMRKRWQRPDGALLDVPR